MSEAAAPILAQGALAFTIESRVLRELGERLVKQPEVAIVELIKNAYDADATECTIHYDPQLRISVEDDGDGITFGRFRDAWMRIGTSSKENAPFSARYSRLITGEKGIGRFAVRFLGHALSLDSIAFDRERDMKTRLVANFDWPRFDRNEDLGNIKVPFTLTQARNDQPLGTKLIISQIRTEARKLDLKKVRTGSINILTPLRSMFRQTTGEVPSTEGGALSEDPGFSLIIEDQDDLAEDVAAKILDAFSLRVQIELMDDQLALGSTSAATARPICRSSTPTRTI
jgi:hypothetical protein